MKKKFNINNAVYVELKDIGFRHWKANEDFHLPEQYQKPLEYYYGKRNTEGLVHFQFWEFMRIFGNELSLWETPMFQTDIFFDESDLK